MPSAVRRTQTPVPAALSHWGPRLAQRVVDEVRALAGGQLRPEVERQLVDLTLHGYDTYLAMLGGDDAAGGPERMAELVGDVFDDMEVSLEDAISLHRHLEHVLRNEVRETVAADLPAGEVDWAEQVAQRFFNDLSAALTDGWLAARGQHERDRAAAEAALLDCLLAVPPRLGQARQLARMLAVDLAVAWEVAVLEPAGGGAASLSTVDMRIRQSLWGSVVLVAPSGSGVVVAVHRRGTASPWPEAGPGMACGIGGTHASWRGLRQSHEEAREALDIARRRRLPQLRFDEAWFDRFLLGTVTAVELAEVALAPLADLAPGRRETALETLEAYLDCGGSVSEMAEALHMHRQSVNYRVGNLRRLLGPALRSADGRLALHIAVKALRRDGAPRS